MDVVQKLCPKECVKIEMPPEEDYDWEEAVKKEASLAEQETPEQVGAADEAKASTSGPQSQPTRSATGKKLDTSIYKYIYFDLITTIFRN